MCVYFKTHWRPSNQMTRHSSHAWNILMGEPLFLLHIFLSIFKRMFFEQLWKIQLDSLLKTNATPKLKPLVKEGKMFYWAIFWRQTFLNRIMLSAQFLGGGVSVFSLLTTILSYMSPLLPPSTHVCKATELKQTAGNHSLTYLPILIIKEFESLTRAAYIFCFLRTKIKFWVPCNLKFNPVLPRLTRLKHKRYHFPYSSELLAVWLHSHERLLIRLFAMRCKYVCDMFPYKVPQNQRKNIEGKVKLVYFIMPNFCQNLIHNEGHPCLFGIWSQTKGHNSVLILITRVCLQVYD